MTIFALMFVPALLSTPADDPSGASLSLKLAMAMAGTLLLACANHARSARPGLVRTLTRDA